MLRLLFARHFLCVATLVLGAAQVCSAGDVLDNAKLTEMVREGVAFKVVLQLIEASTCHFDSSSKALIELQKAGNDGKWPPEDIGKLQAKLIEVANQDKKRLKELVDKAVGIFENVAVGDEEYERIMRELTFEGKTTVPYLLKQLQQESERKRVGVVDVLGRLGDKSEEVTKSIVVMLTDRAKPVREMAARTVAGLHTEQTCPALIEQLNNRNPTFLDGVAMALGYLKDARAIEPLTNLLKTSVDDEARVSAAVALGQLRAKTPAALSALLEAVLDEHNPKLRDRAAEALALIGERKAISYINKAYQRFRTGREDLIKHLAFFKDSEAMEFLLELVNNADNPQVKKATKETLMALTGENYDSGEEYRAWWEINKDRLDWSKGGATNAPKIPEPRSGAL